MSIWLYTIRNHKIKPKVEFKGKEIPVFHYRFCKSHAFSRWEKDEQAKQNYINKAKKIFYPTILKDRYCPDREKYIWTEEFEWDVKKEFQKGILVSLRKRKGDIYFQKHPCHTYYDCDDIYGEVVGEFVNGKPVLNEVGKEILSRMIA